MLKSFKDTRRGMFLLDKTEIKNSWVWIGTLGDYYSVVVTILKILIHLTFQRKKGMLHFENGAKAHDAGAKWQILK